MKTPRSTRTEPLTFSLRGRLGDPPVMGIGPLGFQRWHGRSNRGSRLHGYKHSSVWSRCHCQDWQVEWMTGLCGPNRLSERAGRRWMRGGTEGRGESIREREYQEERWRNDGVLLWLQAKMWHPQLLCLWLVLSLTHSFCSLPIIACFLSNNCTASAAVSAFSSCVTPYKPVTGGVFRQFEAF